MSTQDEPVSIEPSTPLETQEPAVSTVESTIAGNVNTEQNATVENSVVGSVVAGKDSTTTNSMVVAVVAGGDVLLTNSMGVVTVAGGKVELNSSKSCLLITQGSAVENSTIGVLFSPEATLGNDVKVIMTSKQALLIGAALGLIIFLLGRLFRRR
jgi:hypothetical protein